MRSLRVSQTIFYRKRVNHVLSSEWKQTWAEAQDESIMQFLQKYFRLDTKDWVKSRIATLEKSGSLEADGYSMEKLKKMLVMLTARKRTAPSSTASS